MDKRMHAVANDETLRPLDYWIGYRFGLIATRVGVLAARQYRAKHRLTTPLWRVLAVVARFEPLSASTLSEHSRLDPPKVSRAIERLVERKLLLRRTDKADERRAVLTLTARGRAIHDDIAAYVTALEDRISSTLNASEERTMWTILAKLDKQLRVEQERVGRK